MTSDQPGPCAALDHVTVCARDLDASLPIYDAALASLGWSRVIELVDEEEDGGRLEAVAFGPDGGRAQLWLVTGAEPTRALHVALRVGHRRDVERFHDDAVAVGAESHSAPRRWPIYRRGEFHAIVRDPDGNLVEAVSPE